MAFKASCQTLAYTSVTTTVYADVSKLTSSCTPTIYSAYGENTQADTDIAREVDNIWGASAFWDTPSMVGLAMALMEHETDGHGANWLQLTTSAAINPFYSSIVTLHQESGTPTLETSAILDVDSINAQVAMWHLSKCIADEGSLVEGVNYYNGFGGSDKTPTQGSYGASVLWVAYGKDWASASGIHYIGQYMATGPSGQQMKLVTNGTYSHVVYEPGFTVPSEQWFSNYSYNSAEKRIFLLANSSQLEGYVNGLLVEQWLDQNENGKSAFLTGDAGVAAYSAAATVTYDCVITIGSDAASAIQNQGYSLTEYSNFSDWESGTANNNPGFIAATGYTEVLDAVKAAVAAGW
jgi:hypothetical protein